MGRTEGGSTENCIWPLIRMVGRSERLSHRALGYAGRPLEAGKITA